MKKLLAIIFSLAILSGCAAGTGTEVTETNVTSETSAASVASEKTETTTVTTAETATVTTEAADTSGVDYIKEAIRANWDGGEHNDNKWKGSQSLRSSVFFADLNADGVDELFTACHYRAGSTGCVSVYDVSDGAKLLCEMESRTYPSTGALYTDSNGVLHYIIRSEYWNSSDIFHTAYFDLTYTENGVSLTVPFCALPDTWYDGGEFKSEYSVYTDCGYDVSDVYSYKSYGFKISEDNYIGNYSIDDISYSDNGETDGKTDSGEIKELIQKSVFDGLTYVCDTEPFFAEPSYGDFDEFWDSVSVKIAEVYGNTAAAEEKTLTAAELGVNGDGSLSEVFTSRLADFAAPYIENGGIRVYPALYDFDYDGVPEIILIHHNSGQGLMPCEVYSAYDLEKIGEFEGFCRDGFTRFSAGRKGGTIIHNYYEHSNWQRSESVLYASITDGKFAAEPLYNRYGITVGGQYNAVMSINETVDEKTFGKLYSVDFLDTPERLIGYVEFSDKDIKPDIQSRFAEEYAAESYYADADYNSESLSAAVTESYNNYIRLKRLSNYDDKDTYCLAPMGDKNQTAFFFDKNGVFFIDETDNITQLSDSEYFCSVKKLWDSLVVFQMLGNSSPCFVYTVSGGEPRLVVNGDVSFFGSGMYFDYSSLYNGGFEMIHSVYDATSFGSHTFKKYQFYFSADGIREYGSIVVPWEEFSSAYESAAKKYADELAAEGYEIYEVLYRGDYCFILNCRQQLYADDPPEPINGYNNMYIVLKPFIDPAFNGFDEIERDRGFYLTALIPEIADYPEKMYVEEE